MPLRRRIVYRAIIGLIMVLALSLGVRGVILEMGVRGLYDQITDLRRQISTIKMAIPPLRDLAKKCGIYIGTAVERSHLDIPDYANTLKREFNIITTENALKFGPVHPQPDYARITK